MKGNEKGKDPSECLNLTSYPPLFRRDFPLSPPPSGFPAPPPPHPIIIAQSLTYLFVWFTGKTQYRLALEKAFSLLKGSVSGETGKVKKRVILFLTDGEHSDPNKKLIFETIRDRNLELNNTVIILTYGFGDADQFSEVLEDIAKQNTVKYNVSANTSVGDITVRNTTI